MTLSTASSPSVKAAAIFVGNSFDGVHRRIDSMTMRVDNLVKKSE
jgi:hypothetical protein